VVKRLALRRARRALDRGSMLRWDGTDDTTQDSSGLREASFIHGEDGSRLATDLNHLVAIADRLDACVDEHALKLDAGAEILHANRSQRGRPFLAFFPRRRGKSRGFIERCIARGRPEIRRRERAIHRTQPDIRPIGIGRNDDRGDASRESNRRGDKICVNRSLEFIRRAQAPESLLKRLVGRTRSHGFCALPLERFEQRRHRLPPRRDLVRDRLT
jgi:hypothetical protein